MFPESRVFIYTRVQMDSRKVVVNGIQNVTYCRWFRERTLLVLSPPFVQGYVSNASHSSDLKVPSCLTLNVQGQMVIVSNYM